MAGAGTAITIMMWSAIIDGPIAAAIPTIFHWRRSVPVPGIIELCLGGLRGDTAEPDGGKAKNSKKKFTHEKSP